MHGHELLRPLRHVWSRCTQALQDLLGSHRLAGGVSVQDPVAQIVLKWSPDLWRPVDPGQERGQVLRLLLHWHCR